MHFFKKSPVKYQCDNCKQIDEEERQKQKAQKMQ